MAAYVARRLGWALVVLAGVGVLTFVLTYLVPIDPAHAIAGAHATPASIERIRHALGLDRPVLEQLVRYVARVAQGDFGHSYQQDRDVLPLLLQRFPATAELAAAGLTLQLVLGVPLGVLAARRTGGFVDRAIAVVTSVFVATPAFLVGYVLLSLLAFQLRVRLGISVFPLGGYQPLDLRTLALPALTIGLTGAAAYARIVRTSVLHELDADYVRTARAKGIGERRVTWNHAVRNVVPPLLAQIGLDLGAFLGGIVIVERVFSWPGLGKLAVDSIVTADVPLIMGTVLFATFFVVAANLAMDVGIGLANPRVRF